MAPFVVSTCGVPACTPMPVMAVAPIKFYMTTDKVPSSRCRALWFLSPWSSHHQLCLSCRRPIALFFTHQIFQHDKRLYEKVQGATCSRLSPKGPWGYLGCRGRPYSDVAGVITYAEGATPANIAPHRPPCCLTSDPVLQWSIPREQSFTH